MNSFQLEGASTGMDNVNAKQSMLERNVISAVSAIMISLIANVSCFIHRIIYHYFRLSGIDSCPGWMLCDF